MRKKRAADAGERTTAGGTLKPDFLPRTKSGRARRKRGAPAKIGTCKIQLRAPSSLPCMVSSSPLPVMMGEMISQSAATAMTM